MDSELPVFGAKSDYDLAEDFAKSSAKLVLAQLGVDATPMEEYPTWDWFNEQSFIRPYVTSTRCPEFDIVDVLFRPTRSKLLKELRLVIGEFPEDTDFVIIFKVYDWGRFIATNIDDPGRTHFHIVMPWRSTPLYVMPLSDYFSQWKAD